MLLLSNYFRFTLSHKPLTIIFFPAFFSFSSNTILKKSLPITTLPSGIFLTGGVSPPKLSTLSVSANHYKRFIRIIPVEYMILWCLIFAQTRALREVLLKPLRKDIDCVWIQMKSIVLSSYLLVFSIFSKLLKVYY